LHARGPRGGWLRLLPAQECKIDGTVGLVDEQTIGGAVKLIDLPSHLYSDDVVETNLSAEVPAPAPTPASAPAAQPVPAPAPAPGPV
jgi:hypothetical protein